MKKILALLILLAVPAFAQVTMEEVGTLSDKLDKASDLFRSYKFDKSVETLNSLIATLEDWEKNGSLQESDEALFKKALEIRAVSFFHLGKEQNAREDFARLIKMDPDLNPEITSSSKILRYFNTVRDSMAGSLTLATTPPDADVTIDGKTFSGNRTIRLLEGLHLLKASSMGYNSFTKEIQVQAGKPIQETVSLKPNARKVYFFLKPQGAKLFVDGKLAGSADVPASSRDEWAQYVSGSGYDPAAVFAIEALYLPPGDHKVEVVAPCFATRKFNIPVSLDAVDNKPGFIKPIELQKETLTLRIDSHPRNAVVEIDGTRYGATPLEIKDFCSGNHLVRVFKEGQGEYSQKIDLRGLPSFELKAKLRPTLLWLGAARDQEVPQETGATFEGSMRSSLQDIPSFNLAFSREENPFLPDTFFTRGVSASDQQAMVRDLCKKYRSEGVLVSKLSSEGEKVIVSLRLYVPGIEGFDETRSLLIDAKDLSFIVKKFDPRKETILSNSVFHDDGGEGVLVLRSDDCPLSLSPGDRITGIDGAAVKSSGEVSKILNEPGKTRTVEYLRGPESRTIEFADTPNVFLYQGPDAGCRKQWLLFNQEILSSEDDLTLAVSKLSLASIEIGLGRFDRALELTDGLSLPDPAGCLVPTQKYLKAVALFNSGRRDAAKAELVLLRDNYRDSRLGNDGKILLLPLVEDLLGMIEPGERR